MEKIICSKCGSGRVEKFDKYPPKEPEPITMEEAAKRGSSWGYIPAVYMINHWVLLCKDCGHRVEYSY